MDSFHPISFDGNLSLSSFLEDKELDVPPLVSPAMVVPDVDLINCTSSGADSLLNPTPMADDVVNVVNAVTIESAPWVNNDAFLDCLRPLLLSQHQESVSSKGISLLKQHEQPASNSIRRRSSSGSKRVVSDDDDESRSNAAGSFRSKQLEQWNQRFQELIDFKRDNGHCNVPLEYPENPSLAHWVKRQRYQHGLKSEGKHSTLTAERQQALDDLGFIWDSHAAGWELRYNELVEFKQQYGHCNVPTKFPQNPPLSIWVKCQRRQFKLFEKNDKSNITPDRIEKLRHIGFVFHPRMHSKMMKHQISMKPSLY